MCLHVWNTPFETLWVRVLLLFIQEVVYLIIAHYWFFSFWKYTHIDFQVLEVFFFQPIIDITLIYRENIVHQMKHWKMQRNTICTLKKKSKQKACNKCNKFTVIRYHWRLLKVYECYVHYCRSLCLIKRYWGNSGIFCFSLISLNRICWDFRTCISFWLESIFS